MTPSTAPPPAVGATAVTERSLTPDLARGAMLLVIAVVHAYLFVAPYLAGGEHTGTLTPVDAVTTAVVTLFAEARGYPMFAALFGYGLVMITDRQRAAGLDAAGTRRVVRRRGRWLLLFGLLHALLLYSGDILGAYGLIALLFAGAVHTASERLRTHAGAWLVLGSLVYTVAVFAITGLTAHPGAEAVEVGPLTDAAIRATVWPVLTVLLAITSAGPFLVGVWAARRRLLERPRQHLRLLRRAALFGIPVAALGGIPQMLVATGRIEVPTDAVAWAFFHLHTLTGYAGGLGYAALIALLAVRLENRRGPFVTALAACGQWSMTCYLLQSVAWVVLFLPYTLNLHPRLGVTGTVLAGAAVWLATVGVAEFGRRAGRRGPAETLLRRLAYGPRRPAATPGG
ncbi:DUF418 domain-containing protein [Thermobifida halotolerans]|uniref:DUF418 domain-containing protein n=1 Tax=Thermobifida halotolerans TaxID=483545 RepID=A0A399G1Q7_9ACTN|nr:DUF418 domain-containing protein [Thermobifida halotolerans]UOE18789.1 DUF418 domain-containing protein [Thermobifida halotolerans]